VAEPAPYFGATQADYLAGVFNTLPGWLDRGLSIPSLMGAKVLYFAGLRPSYGETPTLIVLVRAAVGLILVPGVVYVIVRGDRAHRLLLAIYMLPVLLGASQDRYNLAMQPLLFYFGYRALDWFGAALLPCRIRCRLMTLSACLHRCFRRILRDGITQRREGAKKRKMLKKELC
ncbi:MAG: hypothetical protein IID45_12465, partial [Planctomycetes bacterium]|nr:hypothetical protein [Planctomycetota bacterium]